MSFDSLLNQFAEEDAASQNQALSKSAIIAHNVDPEVQAANNAKAVKQGMPVAFATPATKDVNWEEASTLIDDFHKLPPKTAAFMADPEKAKISHDDHPVLSKIERVLNSWSNSSFSDIAGTVGNVVTWPVRTGFIEAPRAIGAAAGAIASGGNLDAALAAGTESLQQDVTGYKAKTPAGQKVETGIGKTIETVFDKIPRFFIEEGINTEDYPNVGAAAMTAAQMVPFAIGGRAGAKALVHADAIKHVLDTVKESKLAKRSPENFDIFIKEAAKDTPTVSIPVDKVDDILARAGKTPEEALTDPTAYHEAKFEGKPVEVPISDLAGVADHVTPKHIKDMKVDGALSVNEVVEANKAREAANGKETSQEGQGRQDVLNTEGAAPVAPEVQPQGKVQSREAKWTAFDDLPPVTQEDIVGHIQDKFGDEHGDVTGNLKNLAAPPVFNTRDMSISDISGFDRKTSVVAVKKYRSQLENTEAPPILVDGNKFVDGGHMLAAYIAEGRKTIPTIDIGRLEKHWPEWAKNETDVLATPDPAKEAPQVTGGETDTVLLHAGLNPIDGVKAAMKIAGDILDSETGRKVEKLMTPGLDAGKDAKQGVQSLVLPTAKSAEHLQAAELLGAKLGKMHRNQEVAAAKLRADGKMFDKMGVHNEKIPLVDNPGIQFMSDMSQGRQVDPKLQATAEKIKTLFDDRLSQLEAADVPLESVRENYFPGMWSNESRKAFNLAIGGAIEQGRGEGKPLAEWSATDKAWVHDRVKSLMEGGRGSEKDGLAYLTRTPFKGKESFRKGKVFDDIMTAVEFGLEPVLPNPIDLVNLKLAEMDRSIMANDALKDWRAKGDEKFMRVNQTPEAGWVKVNDKYGTVYGPRDMAGEDVYIGRPILGYRIVKEPVADILNNYLSSSLYNNKYVGTIYKGYMGMANALNQAQLGVGSAFHAGFTESEVTISAGANMLKDIYGVATGTRTVGQLAKSAAAVPTSFIKNPMEGDAILKAWRNPDAPMNPRIARVVKAAELAGGGFKLETGLRTEQTAKMYRDWYSEHKVRAAFRSPISAVELMAKPIMDYLVPRQKAGVFAHLADRIIEQNPGKSLEALTPEFRQAWNRVDARLGQVRYDRLFMNNAAKNAVQGLVRAPGWSGGTIAEIGGAFKDSAKFLKEWADTGKAPKELPDRVAYTLSLMGMVTAVNGMLTYLFTGEEPNGTDFWAFRTGGEDEYGRPERFVLPTYLKDVYAYAHDPMKTLTAKTHPILSIISDIVRNKDYYGVTIANEDDNMIMRQIDRGTYALKAFTPFWIRGAAKEAERGGGFSETFQNSPQKLLAPQIGIMPAPSDYTRSVAEKLINKYIGEQIPQGGRTQEQADTSNARREIVKTLRNGGSLDTLPDKLQASLDKMTAKQVSAIEKDAEMTPLQSSFQHLQDPNMEKSIKVWAKANDTEREELRDIYETKINKYILNHDIDGEELDKLNEKITKAEERK
jgi:hypothetical protein